MINGQDAIFSQLKVWVVTGETANGTPSGDLESLASLGITSINLFAQASTATNNGNLIGLTSTYQTSDGATHESADVWFQTSAAPPISLSFPQALPPAPIPMAVQTTATVLPTVQAQSTTAATATASAGLSTNVNVMAQAIGTFADMAMAPAGTSNATISSSRAIATSATVAPTTLAVAGMVSAMKQFDINGNPLSFPVHIGSSSSTPVIGASVQNAGATVVLASGKSG